MQEGEREATCSEECDVRTFSSSSLPPPAAARDQTAARSRRRPGLKILSRLASAQLLPPPIMEADSGKGRGHTYTLLPATRCLLLLLLDPRRRSAVVGGPSDEGEAKSHTSHAHISSLLLSCMCGCLKRQRGEKGGLLLLLLLSPPPPLSRLTFVLGSEAASVRRRTKLARARKKKFQPSWKKWGERCELKMVVLSPLLVPLFL